MYGSTSGDWSRLCTNIDQFIVGIVQVSIMIVQGRSQEREVRLPASDTCAPTVCSYRVLLGTRLTGISVRLLLAVYVNIFAACPY